MNRRLVKEAQSTSSEFADRKPPTGSLARADLALLALDTIPDGLIVVDLDARITFMSKAAEALTGWSESEAMGLPVADVFQVIDARTRASNWSPLLATLHDGKQYSLLPNSLLIRRSGTEVPIEDATAALRYGDGQITGATILFRDVSFSRFMLQRAMHSALHDPLTNLPNRTLLEDRLEQALSSTRAFRHRVAVLFVDLDGFKRINDLRGHAVGDEILQGVAKRLVAAVRGSDTVSRVGGDEFIILLPDVRDQSSVLTIAEDILTRIRPPLLIGEKRVEVTASIGMALQNQTHTSGSDLILDADSAMYDAKARGGNRASFFVPTMSKQLQRKLSLEESLCRGLNQDEFILHYQPQISLKTGKIVGVEALLRWNHPEDGLLLPHSFISVAERSELIVPIGNWVLQELARQQQRWKQMGLPAFVLSANVSAVELKSNDYLYNLDRVVREDGLDLGSFCLEITESVFLDHTEREVSVLEALRERGIRLAIDDFGTGYSGLNYLRRFPIDIIKIDQTFTDQCITTDQNSLLVKAIISLAKSLDKTIIAEGIETAEQSMLLEGLGCDWGQGFYFGRAVSAEAFTKMLHG